MDFFRIETKTKNSSICVYPEFIIGKTRDLMIRGHSFYAIWDEESGLWSTDESDVQRIVDSELYEFKDAHQDIFDKPLSVLAMSRFGSNMWKIFKQYTLNMFDSYHQLDTKVTFQNSPVKKNDYISKRLPYALEEGPFPAYEELMSTLYDPDEREKLEWAIGAIISGDSKKIQKFIVLYGEAGSGKSTVLNIIQMLFEGYYATFEAKALGSRSNQFALESLRTNPLIAIQHDGDLSRIEDNTLLNSIVSHEEIVMNEKHKSQYQVRLNCMLFMGTNQPVKITDAKSGILRRLIDVSPSGRKVPTKRYFELMNQIEFELGAIASHCLSVYQDCGPSHYSSYRPLSMMYETNDFVNFIEANVKFFMARDYVTLQQVWDMYKEYCDEALVQYRMPKRKVREELKSYFEEFHVDGTIGNERVYSYYRGFLAEKVTGFTPFVCNEQLEETRSNGTSSESSEHSSQTLLQFVEQPSLLDEVLSGCLAQYANDKETPLQKWDNVQTTLKEIDTSRLHYVKPPISHIVIDFDLKDVNGRKSFERNLQAASKWPATYAEVSKGGHGIHLHYIYDGDPTTLSAVYSEGIEVKVFSGKSSLRRKLTLCNDLPIAHISSGLPFKEVKKKVVEQDTIKNEKHLRALIEQNLRKEIHPGTKPSIDFIDKLLQDAYDSGMVYDVEDIYPRIMAFANNSSHHSTYCVRKVMNMKLHSERESDSPKSWKDIKVDDLVFYDIEVFPNLFLICFKKKGKDSPILHFINPTPEECEQLMRMPLVGFNNRRYDNHILYGGYLNKSIEDIFHMSQKIVEGSRNAMIGAAYNLSYTDIYDFAMTKQSLKKWEIELGIHHQENAYPWDQPLPEDKWPEVISYCENDVLSTEKTFDHLSADFKARLILSKLSGLTPNDTTQQHVAKIIFGDDPNPQQKFVYTDLSTIFPGYKFENGKSTYMWEEVGEGGYVYAKPGMYQNVALLDIASMHPTSLEQLNAFGPYTPRFSDLKKARILVKHHDKDGASKVLGGALAEFLTDESEMDDLAHALKIAINIVYGLTSAKFDNKFRDPRNVDNIVAKRGALFMILLKNECQKHGIPVAHIKTDSIKIPNATSDQIRFVMDFGKQYGYIFEHEATYERMCLVNNAVYIAKYTPEYKHGKWTATGAQFQHPYVFKTLFSKEPITFDDFCETREVKTALYLDFNESKPEGEHDYHFVGRIGRFVPVRAGTKGGYLYREKDGKYYSVPGGTDWRWKEAELVKGLGIFDEVDEGYARSLVDDAIDNMSQYGDVEAFLDTNTPFANPEFEDFSLLCQAEYPDCKGCPYLEQDKFCTYSFNIPF